MQSPVEPRSARPSTEAGARALFTILLVLPWLWSFTPGPSPNTAPLLVTWSCLALAIIVRARGGATGDRWRSLLAPAWLAAALLNAVIALTQWFGVTPDIPLVSPAKLAEAYGNLRQKNQFASLTSIGLAVVVFLPPARLRAPALLVAATLLGVANAASASRTGLLQWVLLAVLAAGWPGPRRRRLVVCCAGLAAYLVAAAVLPSILLAWRGLEAGNVFGRAVTDLGCSSRQVLWSNVAMLIAQRPLTGWGVGELDFAHFITPYPGPRFCDILDNAHNLPLHLAVELGIPAAAAIIGALGAVAWRARPWREARPQAQLAWAVLVVIGLHSLLEYPLWYGPFQVAILGALVLLSSRRAGIALQRAGLAMSLVALAGFAYAWSVYDTVSQAYKPPEERRPAMRQDPVRQAGRPPIFRDQLDFAELSVTPLTPANAAHVHALARAMLHYSPEPTVVEKLLDSALLLGRRDEALLIADRYKAAFPERYGAWLARVGPSAVPAD